MSDDLLGDLLSAARRRRTPPQEGEDTAEQAESRKGLNPLDVLNMPPEQRDIVSWLSRRSQASFSEIREAVQRDSEEVRSTIETLKQAGHIHETLIDGEVFYRVVYTNVGRRLTRGIPKDFWDRLDLDNTAFLKQIQLFKNLSHDELVSIAAKLELHQYKRGEVILRQGEVSEKLYFIKNGIVAMSVTPPKTSETEMQSYLREGDTLGEYSMLAIQNRVASATATAMSEVTALIMTRAAFYQLLKSHHAAALELARMLVQQLVAANARIGGAEDTKVCLIFSVESDVGARTLGCAAAMILANNAQKSSVYTEFPDSQRLLHIFKFPAGEDTLKHASGYNVYVQRVTPEIPTNDRATSFLDHLMKTCSNIVIGAKLDAGTLSIVGSANQIVIVTPPTGVG